MNAYLAAYAKDFDAGKPRRVWEEERRDRIMSKKSITVRVVGLRIDVNGDKATARFRQEYRADSLSVNSNKRLELVRSGNKWLIVKESTGS